MANKDILDQLAAEKITRANDLRSLPNGTEVLYALVSSWGREADLLTRSQRKGWQSESKTLNAAIALLKLEILAVEKRSAARPVREPVSGSTPSWTDPQALTALVEDSKVQGLGELIAGDEPCPAVQLGTEHERHTWTGRRDPATGARRWRCAGLSTSVPAPSVADYLSGAVDVPPDWPEGATINYAPDPEPIDAYATVNVLHPGPHATVAVMERLGTHLYRESSVHEEIDAAMPDVHAVPMFREAETPSGFTRPVPPAGAHLSPYAWIDLARPADPNTIPEHMSPSQLIGLDTCPAQMRLSRYEGNPGIPLWGGVGGTAFHAAVEEIESDELADGDKPDIESLWEKHFQLTIAKTLAESGVPMEDWHASNRGKENYSWWSVEGGEMLKGYFAYRFYVNRDDGRKVLILPDGRPAIELELNLDLNGLPIKVILDIVWQLSDGSLEIWDHKTRQDFGGPIVDTIQLGTQGWALDHVMAILLPGTAHWKAGTLGQISARYFDARKGSLTPAFDPLEKHPLEELEMRYFDADDKRRNRPAIPVRSNLCKACPVAYLCPVGNKL